MKTPTPEYYLGKISKILDPDKYEVEIDIPGMTKGAKAFPMRGEVDEPKVGDVCLILSLDPTYHSAYFYSRLKENDFIGIRSRGKKIQMTEDEIEIGIFPDLNKKESADTPYEEDGKISPTSYVKIDKSGNITINMESDQKITILGKSNVEISGETSIKIGANTSVDITGNADVKISGNTDVKISGNADLNVSGSTTLTCPNVTVKGGVLQTTGGVCLPTGTGGFCGIPKCPYIGINHVGTKIVGT